MTKFKDKYRIESTRLRGWDYTSAGAYFVTICTKGRVPFFGDVVDGNMILSPIGQIVADEWQKTPQIRPYVSLDEWVIMPNHLHGIIIIVETPRRGVSTTAPPGRLYDGATGRLYDGATGRLYDNHRESQIPVAGRFVGRHHRANQINMHQTYLGCRFHRFRLANPLLRSHHPR